MCNRVLTSVGLWLQASQLQGLLLHCLSPWPAPLCLWVPASLQLSPEWVMGTLMCTVVRTAERAGESQGLATVQPSGTA